MCYSVGSATRQGSSSKMMDIIFVEPEETDLTVQIRRLLIVWNKVPIEIGTLFDGLLLLG